MENYYYFDEEYGDEKDTRIYELEDEVKDLKKRIIDLEENIEIAVKKLKEEISFNKQLTVGRDSGNQLLKKIYEQQVNFEEEILEDLLYE